MKKVKNVLLASLFMVGMVTGCSSKNIEEKQENKVENNQEKKVVQVVSPDGLPSMAIAKLIKENPEIIEEYEVKYSIEKTAETLSTSVMKEVPDIAIVPSNMAAVAYNKTKNYNIAGTVGLGSFYIVSTEDLKEYGDLKGKSILGIGKGLTPDITAKSILKEKGIDSESDVTFTYVNATSELVPMILSGKENTAIVPEPALSALLSKKEEVSIFKSLNDEYKSLNKSEYGYPQSTIIVKKEFYSNNKDFVEGMIKSIEESIKWSKENSNELASYCEEIGLSTNKDIIPKAMERANLNFVAIDKMEEDYMSYFKKLFDTDPKSVGGSMPDEGIFIER